MVLFFFPIVSPELRELCSFKRLCIIHVTTEREGCLWFPTLTLKRLHSPGSIIITHGRAGITSAAFGLCQAGVRRDPNKHLILELLFFFLGCVCFVSEGLAGSIVQSLLDFRHSMTVK